MPSKSPARLFPKDGIWYTWTYDEHGRRVQRSTRCKVADRKGAERFARDLEARASAPDFATSDEATLDDAVALFLADRRRRVLAGKRSAETLDYYQRKTNHLRRLMGDGFRLRLLRSTTFDAYVDTRLEEGASPNTLAKELGAARAMLKVAKRAGVWTGDIERVIPLGFSAEYKPRTRWLPLREVETLLGALPLDRAARVAFIVATSARLGESDRACRLDVRPWLVSLRGTKTKAAARSVPLVSTWQQELVALALDCAGGNAPLLFTHWGNIRRDLAQACERVGIAACTPNDLRRTTAHLLRGDGVQLPDVADVLGHVDSRMVERVYGRRNVSELAASLVRSSGAPVLH